MDRSQLFEARGDGWCSRICEVDDHETALAGDEGVAQLDRHRGGWAELRQASEQPRSEWVAGVDHREPEDAYLADGEHGLVVAQLTSPDWTPGYLGWSPRPDPRLVATRHTHGPAIAISKGLDRDRAADESGNQVSIFNRIGSRPLNGDEMHRLMLRDGKPYLVSDDPPPETRRTPAQSQERSP